MTADTQQSQEDSGSAPSLVTESYTAMMRCDDAHSVEAANGFGKFSCAVKLHIDNGPVWIHKDGDPPGQLYVPTDFHEYDLHARKEAVNAEGQQSYSFTMDREVDHILPGYSAVFVCDRGTREWKTLHDERGPWTLPGTIKVSPKLKLCSYG
jgi:hypothetical protein